MLTSGLLSLSFVLHFSGLSTLSLHLWVLLYPALPYPTLPYLHRPTPLCCALLSKMFLLNGCCVTVFFVGEYRVFSSSCQRSFSKHWYSEACCHSECTLTSHSSTPSATVRATIHIASLIHTLSIMNCPGSFWMSRSSHSLSLSLSSLTIFDGLPASPRSPGYFGRLVEGRGEGWGLECLMGGTWTDCLSPGLLLIGACGTLIVIVGFSLWMYTVLDSEISMSRRAHPFKECRPNRPVGNRSAGGGHLRARKTWSSPADPKTKWVLASRKDEQSTPQRRKVCVSAGLAEV